MLIEYEGKKIGMIHGAAIDWEKKQTGSGGIFIWDEDFWMTKAPISASILMTDMSTLYGLKETYIKVLSKNKNAISFNKLLGYKKISEDKQNGTEHYVLRQDHYQMRRNEIIKTLLPELNVAKIKITFDLKDEVDVFYYTRLVEIPNTMNVEVLIEE